MIIEWDEMLGKLRGIGESGHLHVVQRDPDRRRKFLHRVYDRAGKELQTTYLLSNEQEGTAKAQAYEAHLRAEIEERQRVHDERATPPRQQLHGRRGAVFSVRVTEDERQRLEASRAAIGGPRGLGPWMLWRALNAPAEVVPAQPGPVVPGPGSTPPGAVVPDDPPDPPVSERVILDLCAGSGSWSKPYELAGYRVVRVTLPENDVRTFVPPPNVWGILAAPPCDQFSLVRNGHRAPRDFVRGLEVVSACLRIIMFARPRWWALENPVGHLSKWLGTPRDSWDPCDFGDPWTKRTAIWGDYTLPTRGPFVLPLGGGPFCPDCDPSGKKRRWCNRADHRARTPQGFARAFFEANP